MALRALIGSAFLALVCLVLARFLPAPAWIAAVAGVTIALAAALWSLFALGLGRLPWGFRPAVAAPLAAIVALGLRSRLRGQLATRADGPAAIVGVHPAEMFLAALSLTGALVAIYWAISALRHGTSQSATAAGALSLLAGLYALWPALGALGVRGNVMALPALLLVAGAVWAIELWLSRRQSGRLH